MPTKKEHETAKTPPPPAIPPPLEEGSWDPGTCDFMNQLDSKCWMFNKCSKWYSSWEERSIWIKVYIESVQFTRSVLLSSVTAMDCSMPGFPVHHQLPELAQTYLHQVSDAIQPSHPLSSVSPFNLSQHQGLFQGVLCIRWPKYWSFSLASALPLNIQDWFPLGLSVLNQVHVNYRM